MPEMISRHRPLALLAAVIAAQVLLLAFQIRRGHDVRLIRYWAVEAMSPLESGGTWSLSRVGGVWTDYVDLHNARAENRELHAKLNELQLRNVMLEAKVSEAQRLQTLLDFRNAHPEASMLAAQVIGASADPISHTILINRGERDHVRMDEAVITPDGIVGKIVEVLPNAAQVQLISDRESGVGVLFADTRTHGVVEGTGDPTPRMNYVVNDEKVHSGEEILTSGDDRIFPKGLLVGTVASAKPGNPFQAIKVQPAARLDRLEDVIVLLSRQELTPRKSSEVSGGAGIAVGLPAEQQSSAPAPKSGQPPASDSSAAKSATPQAKAQQAPPVHR